VCERVTSSPAELTGLQVPHEDLRVDSGRQSVTETDPGSPEIARDVDASARVPARRVRGERLNSATPSKALA